MSIAEAPDLGSVPATWHAMSAEEVEKKLRVDPSRGLDAAEAAERQKAEAKQAEQRRLKWIQDWTQYAINSLPYNARREAEMEVHAAVQELLSALDPSQP